MTRAYLCPALDELRTEINRRWPNRAGGPIGWIGDPTHQAQGSASDHNPDAKGEVHAIDVPVAGIDAYAVVRAAIGDPRCWYVIFNRIIWSRTTGMTARDYTGSNPHTDHVHISSVYGPRAEDRSPWALLPIGTAPEAAPEGDTPGRRALRLASPYMHGRDVAYVQRFIGPDRCGAADGVYGPHTAAGVRWYQGLRGIQVDGIVGPHTWAQLLSHG